MAELGPWLILFLPLLSAASICFGLHKAPKIAIGVSVAAVWTGFLLALTHLGGVLEEGGAYKWHDTITWMAAGPLTFEYGILLDGLSMVMLLVVLGVGGYASVPVVLRAVLARRPRARHVADAACIAA